MKIDKFESSEQKWTIKVRLFSIRLLKRRLYAVNQLLKYVHNPETSETKMLPDDDHEKEDIAKHLRVKTPHRTRRRLKAIAIVTNGIIVYSSRTRNSNVAYQSIQWDYCLPLRTSLLGQARRWKCRLIKVQGSAEATDYRENCQINMNCYVHLSSGQHSQWNDIVWPDYKSWRRKPITNRAPGRPIDIMWRNDQSQSSTPCEIRQIE